MAVDLGVEDLEKLADQYLGIAAQFRVFRQRCNRPGTTQQELDVADHILLELNNEITVNVSMIREMIWAKRITAGAPEDRQPPGHDGSSLQKTTNEGFSTLRSEAKEEIEKVGKTYREVSN